MNKCQEKKVSDKQLPDDIQFVWHGVNDETNLTRFLKSDIEWGEIDARLCIDKEIVITRNASFEVIPFEIDSDFLSLDNVLKQIKTKDKSAKIDLKENGILLEKLLDILDDIPFEEDQLWFTGNIEQVTSEGFQLLSETYPDAIIQCTGNFLLPMILEFPVMADDVLSQFKEWGINRLSIDWTKKAGLVEALQWLSEWGMDFNIYNVPDLKELHQAITLNPVAITSDFDFPEWNDLR